MIVPTVLHPAPDEELIVDRQENCAPAYARDEDQLAPGEGVVRHLSVGAEDGELKIFLVLRSDCESTGGLSLTYPH